MKTYAFVFARGGSKGLPGKNILELDGKPLLAYSIELAQTMSQIDNVFVSTDDSDIATVAKQYGAEVIKRPKELSQDDSPEWLAWRHAVEWFNNKGETFDRFVSLPTTSPLRSVDDVVSCLELFDSETDLVATMTETSRSPYFNMVKEDNGYVKLMIETSTAYARRQDVPKAYDMTTVAYVTRPSFIMETDSMFKGRVKAALVPTERALDIDTELDFKMAEFLINHRKENL